MLAWCEAVGITFGETTRSEPPTNARWRDENEKENSYLPVIAGCIRRGAKEIRVFNDDNLRVVVEHLNEQEIKHEIVAFNAECVHVKIVRG